MTKLAILGAGRMAKVHATAISTAGIKVATIFDIHKPAAEALAGKLQADVATSAHDAVSRSDVDAVLVVTSNNTHFENIMLAVKAGKSVMCEKPLASTLKESIACVDALGGAAENVFLAFNRRYDANHMALKSSIDAGDIGKAEQITITSRDPSPPPYDYIKTSGGLFRDMMIHDFDMARWLLGEDFVRLNAVGASLVDPKIGELGDIDTAMVTMETASGKQVVILNSRRASYGYDQRIEVFGSTGMAISDNPRKTSLLRYSADMSGNRDILYDFFLDRYAQSFQNELLAFLEHVNNGSPMPVNTLDGLKAACLAEAAETSLFEKRPVNLDDNGMPL
ncbi:MAG: inositol 2-dehydrogenase [Rhizobiaceae bacterium]|nr:inositol 2-dehydrogenase [Rhizobiaceae bacterium]